MYKREKRRKGLKLEILDSEDITKIHNTSMRILKEVGVRINHEKILNLFSDGGALVNRYTKIVKIPENLVLDSIAKGTKKHIIYGRDPNKKARFGYNDPIFMSSSGQYLWADLTKKKRRQPVLEDTRRAILMGDALENIDIVGALAVPSDLPPQVRDIHLYAELIKNTAKPGSAWLSNGKTAKYVIEMFKVLAGGEKELRNRPMIEAFVAPISPLQFTREGLEILIEFAKIGLPVGFGPMAMAIATAPATLAGTIAQENAEILAGVVISQLLFPSLPVTYWGIPHVMDPSTGNISGGSPEQGLMAVAIAQLAKHYDFPVGLNVGLTDAKIPDAQAGLEKGMTLLLGALSGADIYGHMGISGLDQAASLPQLIIDNEMAGYLRRVLKSFEINEDTLAFEVIKRVGVGGQFLVDEHTLRHYRDELWFPQIFDRANWDAWMEKGGKSLLELSIEMEEAILKKHRCEPLDQDIRKEIDRIVRKADNDILGVSSSN